MVNIAAYGMDGRGAATMLQGYWKRVKAAKKLIRRLSCLTSTQSLDTADEEGS